MASTRNERGRYHHGDLRDALIRAGLEATRTAGPGGLGLREVTRRVGVSPNAAYRHFADRKALVRAVSQAIQERMAVRMRPRRSGGADSSAEAAVQRLRAVGLGYIRFALAEPGWFSVAFFGGDDDAARLAEPFADDAGAPWVPPPYTMLVEALDGLAAAGVITPARRADAEWPCFSAVHGFAELALHGPLRGQPRATLDGLAIRTVDAIIVGVVGRE